MSDHQVLRAESQGSRQEWLASDRNCLPTPIPLSPWRGVGSLPRIREQLRTEVFPHLQVALKPPFPNPWDPRKAAATSPGAPASQPHLCWGCPPRTVLRGLGMGGGAHGTWLLRVRERQNPGGTLHLPGDRSPVALKTRLPQASSAQAGRIASGKAVLAVGPGGGAGAHGGGPRKLPRPEGAACLVTGRGGSFLLNHLTRSSSSPHLSATLSTTSFIQVSRVR